MNGEAAFRKRNFILDADDREPRVAIDSDCNDQFLVSGLTFSAGFLGESLDIQPHAHRHEGINTHPVPPHLLRAPLPQSMLLFAGYRNSVRRLGTVQ